MKQGTVVAAVRDLEGFLLGEDPTRVDFLWQRMYRQGFWRGGVAILSAISGLEQALWDTHRQSLRPAGLQAAGRRRARLHPLLHALR